MITTLPTPDVMQVCRNGHVVTDLLQTYPERGRRYCERCGADTLDHCATCGRPLPGAVRVPGLAPVGAAAPPSYCPSCGAAFPWTASAANLEKTAALEVLEKLLRRVPRVVRQLRNRHGDRPPFTVTDEKDLEDLLRALLPLHFDDVRLNGRTPLYAAGTRTDFLLLPEGIALTVKNVERGRTEKDLADQLQADAAHYAARRECETLVAFVHDPEGWLREPALLERAWARLAEAPPLHCVIAS
jgi:hypothetical protein